MKTFYSNGKLLLTGEYLVLDGALSLAVPTKYGQSLIVEPIEEQKIIWNSLDENNQIWFEGEFKLINHLIICTYQNNLEIANRIVKVLNTLKQSTQEFLATNGGFKITTKLDFPKHWGLGTSSTLINNIAQWANVDAYQLLKNTFGGSGYDIACAQHSHPITYKLKDETPTVKETNFNPIFKGHLYFVYLNKKQNSREGIKHYHLNKDNQKNALIEIEEITKKMIGCDSLGEFETLLNSHETIISKVTKQTPVKQLMFADFSGSIKSLGAWGGDFVLVTSNENPAPYFHEKGFQTILAYKDMVL